MGLKLLFNIVSPPSRAILILADKLNLKLEKQVVNLAKGEQFKPEFTKVSGCFELDRQPSIPPVIR